MINSPSERPCSKSIAGRSEGELCQFAICLDMSSGGCLPQRRHLSMPLPPHDNASSFLGELCYIVPQSYIWPFCAIVCYLSNFSSLIFHREDLNDSHENRPQ